MIIKGSAKGNVSYGFWVGLGVLLAYAVWRAVSYMLQRAGSRADG
jgi:hypothetical protein